MKDSLGTTSGVCVESPTSGKGSIPTTAHGFIPDPEPGQPQAQPFRRLKNPETLNTYDTIFINTPTNGQCEGVHLQTEWALVFETTDEGLQEKRKYCDITHFSYWGNGSDISFEDTGTILLPGK